MPKFSERTLKETPFATDFASSWLVTTPQGTIDTTRVSNYAQAIRLAGINTVRERVEMNRINPEKGRFNYSHTNITAPLIAEQNLDISAVFHDTPEWAKTKNASLGKDLFDIYNVMKDASAAMAGKIDNWEIWNEQDAQFYTKEPADIYSSYFKAAAIGVADGSPNTKKSMGGLSINPKNSGYADLMLQSGIMDYSDIYNYHAHIIDNGNQYQDAEMGMIDNQNIERNKYDRSGNEMWVTEAGMFAKVDATGGLSNEKLRKQARYAVTGTVTSMAKGTDKQFWFIIPSYKENGADFGTFTADNMPHPAYASMAIMTNVLGESIYKGEFKNLPSNVNGELFSNGGNDVGVLWGKDANNQTVTVASKKDVTVVNMMGEESTAKTNGTNVSVSVGLDPVYLKFYGECSSENYLSVTYKKVDAMAKSFSPAQKLVMVASPDKVNYTDAKNAGYRMQSGNTFVVDLYNFSDTKMTGNVSATSEFAGTVVSKESNIEILPKSKKRIEFIVTATTFNYDHPYDVAFEGVFNGEKISPMVCHMSFEYPSEKLSDIKLFYDRNGINNTSNISSWNIKNINGGNATAIRGLESGSIRYEVDFTAGNVDNWFYPAFSTAAPKNVDIAKSDGLAFTITSDVVRDDVSLNAFAHYAGGSAVFFLGTEPYFIEKGTHTYYIPWERFSVQGVNNELSPIPNPSKITSVMVGISTKSSGKVIFTVNNMGYYENTQVPVTNGEIIISGITDKAVIKVADLAQLNIAFPSEVDKNTVRYVVNNQDKTLDEVKNLGKGKYVLNAVGYTDTFFAISKTITFLVE